MRAIPWLLALALSLVGCALGGCAGTRGGHRYVSEVPGLSEERLLAGSDEPVLFLGPERDAPAVGYASADLSVRLAGSPQAGRVLIKVLGALEVQAHVPSKLLSLRVQRRGRVRGTPTYVGPGDRLRVLGPAAEAGRVRVVATPSVLGHRTQPYEGTYPVQGLAAKPAPATTSQPEPGAAYELAAGLPFSLYDLPNGNQVVAPSTSPLATDVTVLRQEGAWYAVRVGSGPYLIGYTSSQLKPRKPGAVTQDALTLKSAVLPPPANAGIPVRLVHERGELKRVAAGTQLFFNNAPFAILRSPGWARVLAEYPNGEVDAFVAADDHVAVRALLSRSALSDAPVPTAGAADTDAQPRANESPALN